MQLEKQIVVKKIEVEKSGVVYVEMAIRVKQSGKTVSQTLHSFSIAPGEDYSKQPEEVQMACAEAHTPKVIEEYKASHS